MPSVKTSVKRTGGKKLDKFLREAGKGGVSSVKVGFFSTAKYQDGTPVAAVAAWNEFGTQPYTINAKSGKKLAFTGSDGETVFADSVQHPGIPERPFFRRAIASMEDGIGKIIEAGIDPKKGVVDNNLADTVGAYAQGEVQNSILDLKEPPNAPSTIAAKGSDDPLIDEGTMNQSVTWRVEK